jgi:hypothetical protein
MSHELQAQLGPLIDDALDEIAPYDAIMWHLTFVVSNKTLVGCLAMVKPSPQLGSGLTGGTEVDARRLLMDDDYRQRCVRTVVDGLHQTEIAVLNSMQPPNGQHRP